MLQKLLNDQVLDPKNPQKIFDLAKEYDRLGQGAMAVSLYLKAADLSKDKLLQYKSVLGIALCYDRQGNRRYTVEGALLDAAALMPDRPEAYYFLAKHYEVSSAWKQVLLYSRVGLNGKQDDLDLDVGYPGRKALACMEAIAKWYITGTQEGKHALFDLKFRTIQNEEYKLKIDRLLNNAYYPDTIPYTSEDFNRFKFLFPGLERVHENYSKHYQDLFVLAVFNGKKNGTYLEIGSGDPFVHNNTALLETEFGWRGISIDNNPALCCNFKENRHNTVICADAKEIGYQDMFEKHCVDPIVDYLQIDCDEASIEVLKKHPLSTHKFGVVTFEHDCYRLGTEIRDEARAIMKKHGYVLLVNDVAFTELCSYEDWYVHPDVVEINPAMRSKKDINFVWEYFMEELNEENEKIL
jgi:tetratricopeptide (TPR) repeat protein